MVNPGAFQGIRKTFLISQKPRYAIAVAENHVADTLADIQRSFFKRFSLDLPADQDPTSEELSGVDDSTPDPEP
ncbi:hypothetical protein FPV67DRAFT_1370730, partial [Lyophyllum atratum]